MDTSQLTKSTFLNSSIRAYLRDNCPIYNPVQFKPSITFDEIEELAYRGDFHCLVPQYEREDETFELSQLNFALFNRFVQLLAPLTLHLFRTSSKHVYYECLDIRGLDTREIMPLPIEKLFFRDTFSIGDGFLDTKWNPRNTWDNQLIHYQICHGRLTVTPYSYMGSSVNFVKKYKTLTIEFTEQIFLDKIDDICDAVFHPGVERVEVVFQWEVAAPSALWLKNYGIFIGYCKSTRTCYFNHFWTEPMSLEMKKLIEKWAVTAVNLEDFVCTDYNGYCQMHEGKLKYCRIIDGEGYLFDSTNNLNNWDLCWPQDYVSNHNQFIRYEDAVLPFRETLNPRLCVPH